MKDHKNVIWTIPNALTYLRLILIPVVFLYGKAGMWIEALLVGGFAALTDFFDGKIARAYNIKSIIGAFLDPIADKGLVVAVLWAVDPQLGQIVFLLEFVGALFSNSVRKDEGGHFIMYGSKGITFAQMTFMLILIVNRLNVVDWFYAYDQQLFGAMIALSLSRLFMYSSCWNEKRILKQKEKNEHNKYLRTEKSPISGNSHRSTSAC